MLSKMVFLQKKYGFNKKKMRNEILNLTYRNYALELNVGNCVFITKSFSTLKKLGKGNAK